jgi:hypothetical protein
VHQATKEGSGGKHNTSSGKVSSVSETNTDNRVSFNLDRGGFSLYDDEVRDAGQELLNPPLIQVTVSLGTGRLSSRPLTRIQSFKLNAGGVDSSTHQASKGVELLNQVPLAHSTDGGITGHLTDTVPP